MKNYSKIEFEIKEHLLCSEEEAINNGFYNKVYYDEFGQVDKKESFVGSKLSKVFYPNRQHPFNDIVELHFNCYSGLPADIQTPKEYIEDGGYLYTSYVYKGNSKELIYIIQRCHDKNNNIIKEIEFNDKNEINVIHFYEYTENNELLRIIEKNSQGQVVGRVDF